MVRSKVNRFTLQSDNKQNPHSIIGGELMKNIELLDISKALSNNNTGSSNIRPKTAKSQTETNQNKHNKNERYVPLTVRKRTMKVEEENKKPPFQFVSPIEQEQQNQEQDLKLKKHSETSSFLNMRSSKKSSRARPSSGRRRSKQRYYIIDEHGDSTELKQARAFSDESLECMEIMKAAISDVVQEKITQITSSQFQNICDRLDNISVMVKKNEAAIVDCVRELRTKLKYYGEDTSRHLKYLCMKLEYEKLMAHNFSSFLASDTTHNICLKTSKCSHGPLSGSCSQRLYEKKNSDSTIVPSCCCVDNDCISSKKSSNNNLTNPLQDSKSNATKLDEEKINDLDSTKKNSINLIPSIVTSFIKYKRNSTANPTLNPPADGQDIVRPSSGINSPNPSSDLCLKDILDAIQQYYPPNTAAEKPLDLDIRDDEDEDSTSDDTEATEEGKGSADDSEENFCKC